MVRATDETHYREPKLTNPYQNFLYILYSCLQNRKLYIPKTLSINILGISLHSYLQDKNLQIFKTPRRRIKRYPWQFCSVRQWLEKTNKITLNKIRQETTRADNIRHTKLSKMFMKLSLSCNTVGPRRFPKLILMRTSTAMKKARVC